MRQLLNNCILDLISLLIRFIISIQISSMASFWRVAISRGLGGGGGGGGGTWVNFGWVCAAGLSEPLPHYGLFYGQL